VNKAKKKAFGLTRIPSLVALYATSEKVSWPSYEREIVEEMLVCSVGDLDGWAISINAPSCGPSRIELQARNISFLLNLTSVDLLTASWSLFTEFRA
jgi:hypothetical protein